MGGHGMGKYGRKTQAVNRATGNTLKWQTELSWHTGPPLPQFCIPHKEVGLLWNSQLWAATAGCGEDLWEPSDPFWGHWYGHRACRPGHNQLRQPMLWAICLPKWSGSVSSSSPQAWLWLYWLMTGVYHGRQAVYSCLLQVWKRYLFLCCVLDPDGSQAPRSCSLFPRKRIYNKRLKSRDKAQGGCSLQL